VGTNQAAENNMNVVGNTKTKNNNHLILIILVFVIIVLLAGSIGILLIQKTSTQPVSNNTNTSNQIPAQSAGNSTIQAPQSNGLVTVGSVTGIITSVRSNSITISASSKKTTYPINSSAQLLTAAPGALAISKIKVENFTSNSVQIGEKAQLTLAKDHQGIIFATIILITK